MKDTLNTPSPNTVKGIFFGRSKRVSSLTLIIVVLQLIFVWQLILYRNQEIKKAQPASPGRVALISKEVKTAPWNNCPDSTNAWGRPATPKIYIDHTLDAGHAISNEALDELTKSIDACISENAKRQKFAAIARDQKAAVDR